MRSAGSMMRWFASLFVTIKMLCSGASQALMGHLTARSHHENSHYCVAEGKLCNCMVTQDIKTFSVVKKNSHLERNVFSEIKLVLR